MCAAHFDAELCPGPDVPDRSPDDVLVKALHKVILHSLELLEGLGLDPPDLCLGDAPQEVVTSSKIFSRDIPTFLVTNFFSYLMFSSIPVTGFSLRESQV